MNVTLESLAASVDARFAQVDWRFEQIDARFEQVDRRFEQIDKRFEQIDARFEQIDARFEQIDVRFERLEGLIHGSVEQMRRHFDIVAEQMKAERNLVLDRSMAAGDELDRLRASNAAAHAVFEKGLANHDVRLTRLEKDARPPEP
jgi:septal ring factor EnvC (AmiA/AmiB activator)